MSASRRARIEFFADHGGYCTPPGRMVCAKSLADAETFKEWAQDNGSLSIKWMEDEEGASYFEDETDRARIEDGTYMVLGCVVTYRRPLGPLAGTVEDVSSLWGIMVSDVSDPYCRVVEAELVSELTQVSR